MPLSMAKMGHTVLVQRVSGKDETRRFLEKLGFVSGSTVTVVNEINGDLIVSVKDARVAISKPMASKIFVA